MTEIIKDRSGSSLDSDPVKLGLVIVIVILLAGGVVFGKNQTKSAETKINLPAKTADQNSNLEEAVIPSAGVTLPVTWGNLGAKLVEAGVIDATKLQALYQQRGGWPKEYRELLLDQKNGQIKITRDNAGYWLNLLWALGLANQNSILDQGEMTDPQYGGAGGFASTGGWSMAKGEPMDHYSRHQLIKLTVEQQALVDKISRGIFRPCCGNSTHFPDCNHGMAMLGLLELMASQGVSETEMWQTALTVNSYWFPDTYLTLASYFKDQGRDWSTIDPKIALGEAYSSSAGATKISALVSKSQGGGGGSSCGV